MEQQQHCLKFQQILQKAATPLAGIEEGIVDAELLYNPEKSDAAVRLRMHRSSDHLANGNGKHDSILGLYRDDEKENGNSPFVSHAWDVGSRALLVSMGTPLQHA